MFHYPKGYRFSSGIVGFKSKTTPDSWEKLLNFEAVNNAFIHR